jgi:hypothetical protein
MVGDPHLATDDLHRLAPLLAELAPDQLLPLPVGEPAEARQQRLELRLAGDGPRKLLQRRRPGVFARRAVVRRRAASSSRTAPSGGS